MTLSVLVSSGELSGDAIAAAVIHALRRRRPDWAFFGAGGPSSARAGLEVVCDPSAWAAVGFSESARVLPQGAAALARLLWQAVRRRPALALLVDSPALNLRLAGMLRRRGVPVLYLVAPQRWAWLPWRTAAVQKVVDHLAVILPFEEQWFAARGVPTTYVGHPLVDRAPLPPRSVARAKWPVENDQPVVALFPGSRPAEVRRHLPILLQATKLFPAFWFPVLVPAPGAALELCRHMAPRMVVSDPVGALGGADAALCASGTATLEACLAAVPTALFYRVSPGTFWLARRLVRVPQVGLPNLLLNRPVVPELLQEAMTPEALVRHAAYLLKPPTKAAFQQHAQALKEILGPPGLPQRVAVLAQSLVEKKAGMPPPDHPGDRRPVIQRPPSAARLPATVETPPRRGR